jgi:hypothetical protein
VRAPRQWRNSVAWFTESACATFAHLQWAGVERTFSPSSFFISLIPWLAGIGE